MESDCEAGRGSNRLRIDQSCNGEEEVSWSLTGCCGYGEEEVVVEDLRSHIL